ncbi:beta-glucosidase [Amycolatopsis sp. RTGN1]|uniref:beta-glucosidase n=1 Tax=Amycolatopsis ponsaeliensis TaxID=2992142 RepID=UPI00254B9735|nr:glycoside hydrolase family 3 C-terminal domain-containing protein [Amycolatopsis sp. RTGN1]
MSSFVDSALDLPAKVALLTGASMFTLRPEPAIGLAELRLSDGPTGVRGLTFSGGPAVTLFPNATLLASAWNTGTAYEVGRLLAEEAAAQGIHVVLGPTINLHRSPLGGRLFEAYSEDPLLSGALAAAYVRGLQDNGVGACLKHLVANESETERHAVDCVVDEATLREVYLLPFEIAVADADAWSIMAAYNRVNGTPATEQAHVITDIVKGEWGYRGLVVSDWWATTSTAPSANAGLDLVMPGPAGPWGRQLVDAVKAGEVDEAVIDDHLGRLLLLAERVGAPQPSREVPAPDSPVRRAQLTRLAAEGMTVLTNEGGVLPLRRDTTVALIGRHAVDTIDMGGGSAQVNPPYQVSVAEGLTELLAVTVVDGVEVRERPVPAGPEFAVHPDTGEPGMRVTLHAADGSQLEERDCPAASTMIGIDDDLPEPPRVVRLSARLPRGGRMLVGGIGIGTWEVRAGGQTVRFELGLTSGDVGEAVLRPPGGTVLVDVEPGELFEADVALDAGRGLYGLVARPAPDDVADVVGRAVAAARSVDVAVVVVGLTEEQETEAVDKTTLRLPGAQDDLVAAVAAVAPHTVVVVNAATPVLMPWLDQVDAVLWAGLPGQEGGHAVAAALLGDIEPAGRLVTTFPAADGASPAWSVTPVAGRLEYAEGPFVGYRGHAADKAPAPAFWLGHGLGYSTWAYSDAAALDDVGHRVAVTVTNTGGRTSREVVQVYFRPADEDQPVRLVGWGAATVEPGQSARVEVTGDPRLRRRWDTAQGSWADLPREGELLLARGLGDVRATLRLGSA